MNEYHFQRATLERLLPEACAYAPEVAQRLQWFLHFADHRSVSETCRTFSIARSTFYRWVRRFDPANLHSLEDQPPVDVHRSVPVLSQIYGVAPVQPGWSPLFSGVMVAGMIANFVLLLALLSFLWVRENAQLQAEAAALRVLNASSSMVTHE